MRCQHKGLYTGSHSACNRGNRKGLVRYRCFRTLMKNRNAESYRISCFGCGADFNSRSTTAFSKFRFPLLLLLGKNDNQLCDPRGTLSLNILMDSFLCYNLLEQNLIPTPLQQCANNLCSLKTIVIQNSSQTFLTAFIAINR